MSLNSIPICPLMSAGNEIPIVCMQDKCAWYLQNLKRCSMYLQGYKTMLEIKEKTEQPRK